MPDRVPGLVARSACDRRTSGRGPEPSAGRAEMVLIAAAVTLLCALVRAAFVVNALPHPASAIAAATAKSSTASG